LNARLVTLRGVGLSELKTASFDVVFATNMLGHLDEIDRWWYVEEAFRVLRPGGRLSIDNIDLESDAGWRMFANDACNLGNMERPPYMPRYSTAAEFISYVTRAGFHRQFGFGRVAGLPSVAASRMAVTGRQKLYVYFAS
jgi:SAM-dependent methyltransferase